jgi:hypothetical protein
VLPKDINTALRLYALIKDHPIDFLFPLGESERRKTDLLIAILLEIRFGTLDNEYAQIWKDLKEALHEHSDELDLQNAKQKKPVDIEPEITFDRQALSNAARQTLQDLADFYGLIEEARIPRLVGVDVPTKVELFNLFKENHRFLKAIEQAIEFFQSPTYQPSRYNIFSSTFGKTAKYQEQLTLAKDLLKACEFQIYDCTKLAKEIEQFLSRSVDHQKPWSFALVLMKVMASNVSPLIPKVDFDLMKAMKNHEKEPELILIEFYSAFKDHFLRTNTFVSEFKFHL